MRSLLLISILAATVLLPSLAARDRSASRGLVRALAAIVAFDAVYIAACAFLYHRLP
ncbi:MAG: hypothetical protein U0359_07305 [Byssovorax sp.]